VTSDVVVAVVSGCFTLIGVIITVVLGNKKTSKTVKENGDLTIYRINELEKKVEKHNSVVERTFVLEGKVLEAQHDIRDIKARL
jgi:hypothetical protein